MSDVKTVFVVDDDETNLMVASFALKDVYQTVTVTSGHRLFEILEKVKTLPDLILLDIEMPEMDGHDVLNIMRATPRYADIPVVFLTAQEYAKYAVGVDAYIMKPFTSAKMIDTVREIIEKAELKKEEKNVSE